MSDSNAESPKESTFGLLVESCVMLWFLYTVVVDIGCPYMRLVLSSFHPSIVPSFTVWNALFFASSLLLLLLSLFHDSEHYRNEYALIWADTYMNIFTRGEWGKKKHDWKHYDLACMVCFFIWNFILLVSVSAFVGYGAYCLTVAVINPFLNWSVATLFGGILNVLPFSFAFKWFETCVLLCVYIPVAWRQINSMKKKEN